MMQLMLDDQCAALHADSVTLVDFTV